MQLILTQLSRGCAHTIRLASLLALLLIAATWSLPAAAAVSPFCPTQTLTVPKGGSVTSANLATCDGPLNLGMIPATPNPNPFNTAHGSVIVNPCCNLGGNQFATYTHNGDTATSDTFQLEDENGDLLTFNVTITAPTSPITVSPASLPALTAGAAFSQTLASSGGVGSYTYALQSGALPVGLTLTSGGVLSGTPTQRGLYAFTVRATDSKTPTAQFADKGYTGNVVTPTLTLTSPTGTAIQNVAFSQTLTVSGGVAPYTCLLETGTFPAGITVSNACVVSGTTAAAAVNYPVTIRVTESSTGPGSYFEVKSYTLTVIAATVPGAPTIGSATPGSGAASIAFTAPGSNGGSAIIDYTVTCNAGSITATGAASPINVTGLTNGTGYTCSVTARNSVGSGSASGTVSVTPKASQTITFTNPGAQVFGTSPTLSATASSTLTPTFSSTTTGVCTITSGGVLSFVTTGACSINANQAGNAAFLPATTVTRAFNVTAASQTVTFAPATPVIFGVAPITLTATATSGLTAFTFATTSAATICTVSGNTLTIVGAGSCALTATQAGNANFSSASAPATIVVNATVPGAPTIGTTLAGQSQVSIAFTAPASNGGAAITSYTASCTPGGFSATGATSPLVVTGLTTGTTYDCSVVATNAVGSGAASAIATVTPSFRTYTGSSPTGSGSITASFAGGGAACTFSEPRFIPLTGDAASPPAGTAPAGVSFPFGLFDFSTTGCTPGSTINMTVVYPGPVDFSAQYWKYGPTPGNTAPHWYLIPSAVGQNSISFAITDGGLGDDDLSANGTIVDQGGVGIPPSLPVPTLSSVGLLLMLLAIFGIGYGGLGRKRVTADSREAATR